MGALVQVAEAYGERGLPDGDPRTTGVADPWLPRFDVTAQWSIGSLLPVLTAEPIVP